MSKVRVGILIVLFMAPWFALMGFGSYYLWHEGWMRWAWIPMFLCIALSYFFAWRWTRGTGLLPPTETPTQNYWTARDKAAWEKVLAKAKSFERITSDQLADPKHYTDLALDLAVQVAIEYRPGGTTTATQAFDLLTLPEVMTCIELASSDLNEMVQKYVPGSHLLRIKDAKRAKQATAWYKTGQNVYWAGSAVINPVETAMRFFASRGILGNLFEKLQDNIILWFHTAFIHQLGHYLVELNSGRLKVGVKRYRELLNENKEPPALASKAPELLVGDETPTIRTGPKPIHLAVLGAVKAGKSSLVNALLGQQAATVDTLPIEHVGVRYNLTLPNGQPVTLLDTAGYGQDGPSEEEFAFAADASQEADLILLVTAANNPGRQVDVDLLDRLKAYFALRPHRKLPPVIAVVNQVDLLSPKAEWNPPYNWLTGMKPKEANIRECLVAVKEQLAGRVAEVVPTCARAGETFGIVEAMVPAVALNLDDARGAAVLKAFEAEGAADQYRRLGSQVVEGARKAWDILKQNWKK